MSFPVLPGLEYFVNFWHYHNNSDCYWEIPTGISRNLTAADIRHFVSKASNNTGHSVLLLSYWVKLPDRWLIWLDLTQTKWAVNVIFGTVLSRNLLTTEYTFKFRGISGLPSHNFFAIITQYFCKTLRYLRFWHLGTFTHESFIDLYREPNYFVQKVENF